MLILLIKHNLSVLSRQNQTREMAVMAGKEGDLTFPKYDILNRFYDILNRFLRG